MKSIFTLIIAIASLVILGASVYTVSEVEQVIITRFGQPVGQSINSDPKRNDAGLHFKIPFVEDVNRFEKRIMQWDGSSAEMTTKEKRFIVVDTFARWRISNPRAFFEKLRDERTAQSRLETILGSEVRNIVAKHDLIEVVRTDKTRKPDPDESGVAAKTGTLPSIQFGRIFLQNEIHKAASKVIEEQDLGIELLDLRLKRINPNATVLEKIYISMISEREKIAKSFVSEGEGKAAEKNGERERELRRIESDAYRKVQEIQGKADAEATQIYAQAYNTSPVAADFYQFLKTMETYKTTMGRDTTLILTTDSDLLKYFKRTDGGAAKGAAKPAPQAPQAPAAHP